VASHTLTVLSQLALARRLPSGLKASLPTLPVWPWRVKWGSPGLVTSQTLTVWSQPPEASRVPSGLNTTLRTWSVCPPRLRSASPVAAFQIFKVVSLLAEARRVPSGLKARLLIASVCPCRRASSLPVVASHSFSSPGLGQRVPLAEARRVPSGLNATHKTWWSRRGPVEVRRSRARGASPTLTVPPWPAGARGFPAGREGA